MAACRVRIDGERCNREHPSSHMVCRQHWYALPKHLRNEVWRLYRKEGVLSIGYLQARENAFAFLENREARDMRAEMTDGTLGDRP